MEYVTLHKGVKMPILGYGVYQVTQDECEQCVLDALEVGYRYDPNMVEWFVNMVEERKTKHDSSKEQKNW